MEQSDLDGAERDVDDVEKALHRLDDGTYEQCEVCGATIPEDLLADNPTRRTCAEHG
jgi:RNA polymerase-binding transcription factor DksA